MTPLSWSRPPSRYKRAIGASLGLLALAMAAAVPTVHAWAHELSESHHHDTGPAVVGEPTSHHDEHPSALHADWLVLRSVDFDSSPVVACAKQEFVLVATRARLPRTVPEDLARCSTPPAPNPARGPPIV